MNYEEFVRRKHLVGVTLLFLLVASTIFSLFFVPTNISLKDIFENAAVKNVRLPRVMTAVFVGASLAVSGAVMQCVLRNPLASSFTLGISQGAAFGAAFAIIYLGAGILHRTGEGVTISNPYIVPVFAFIGALLSVKIVLILSKIRDLSPEAMILAGIAMASFFQASTMLIQYFSQNEVLIASVVFWTFGDVGRTVWREAAIIALSFLAVFLIFLRRAWDYNALLSGDEVAKTLGVDPKRVRVEGLLLSAFLTAICVSFTGIIGFVGLISPHVVRIFLGEDYRFLLPLSAVVGSLMLLLADSFGRAILFPVIIPVGIVTAFVGAPVFIYLLLRGVGR
ncbi:iron ABC transporter permease [Ferroglobus sp.]|uniref:FecCD family ABC transporter permease n=1 Tax=Ferroglobus sp. TaxID=2614230 RepID=UPI0025B81EE1|nr:iron ABC transporter permease [Ferroglobus sp.]